MKYKVDWSSPKQGIRSTTVDALNMTAAKEQVESMYAHIEGFKAFCVSPVFEKKEYSEPQQSYSSVTPNSDSGSGGDGDSFSTMIGAASFFIAAIAILFGLFTLPSGIGAMLVGGAIGWLGWKLACWLSDKGW
jgi:hypothetical protein